MAAPDPIWVPDATRRRPSQMAAFTAACEAATGRTFTSYDDLHRWAVGEAESFWPRLLDWCEIETSGNRSPALVDSDVEHGRFFPDLALNYAQHLLRTTARLTDDLPALSAHDEGGTTARLTRGALRAQVQSMARSLAALGVGPDVPVAAVCRNSAETVITCLATLALGGVWSSVAPDLGTDATHRRFEQFRPAVLFAHTSTRSHGVSHDLAPRIEALCAGLPSIVHLVLLDAGPVPSVPPAVTVHRYDELQASAPVEGPAIWHPRRFNDPMFVLFSSGTTGPPKGIVHGVGGTLVEHLKEHRLHSDFQPGDRLLFQTTCGWMMWNWMLSALASGVELVLYDGSVSYPSPDALLQLIARERVTVLGTSPAYIELLRASGLVPRAQADLSSLRAIQSTGSIMFDGLYDWISENVARVPVQSISGGTDIIGCFVLGHPDLPVYRGEAQCISLGCDVRVLTDAGVEATGAGELVCASPFPSRPVAFLADANRERYHSAYFAQHPGLWWHGDFITITERGTVRMRGRSDGVLNIRGVRIGPAEIYAVLQDFPAIAQAIAVEQRAPTEPGGVRLVLAVTMVDGASLDRPLTFAIKKALAERASRTHVPSVIVAVPSLPTTFSGKLSESAMREALNGDVVRNLTALRNPESLDAVRVAVPAPSSAR